jgi:DNA-binding Lrp family transcriptional regulator
MSTTALAREIGVNRATVTSRIERLMDTGVIESFTIRLATEVDRDAIRGITLVSTRPNVGVTVMRILRGLPAAEYVHSTIGVWDIVVQLRASSLAEFDDALERVRGIDGVTDTQTSLLFNALIPYRDGKSR